jgi:hypothetical protein
VYSLGAGKMAATVASTTPKSLIDVKANLPPPSVVIGIDFGTTYSGWAFALSSLPNEVNVDQSGGGLVKDKTAVLFDRDQKFVAFGQEAERIFFGLSSADQATHFYFQRFKMELYFRSEGMPTPKHSAQAAAAVGLSAPAAAAPDVKSNLSGAKADAKADVKVDAKAGRQVKALNGQFMPLDKVMIACIRHLHSCAKSKVTSTSLDGILKPKEILTILTIPAVWDDWAKEFMRKVAVDAEISDPVRPVVLALESEAASLCCRSRQYGHSGLAISDSWKAGIVYAVADLGGGTGDIAVHKVTEKNLLGEVQASSGGPWGSSYVDDAFWCWLKSVFGDHNMDEYKKTHAVDFLELMNNFQVIKHTIDPKNNSKTQRMSLPLTFYKFIQSKKKTVQRLVREYAFKKLTGNHMPSSPVPTASAASAAAAAAPAPIGGPPSSEEGWLFIGDNPDMSKSILACDAFTPSAPPAASAQLTPPPAPAASMLVDLKLCDEIASIDVGGRLKIATSIIIEEFFMPLINAIVSHLEKEIVAKSKLDFLFLVGGFSQSPLLLQHIQEKIGKKHGIKVVSPPHSSMAVLTGSVLYGLNQKLICSRIVKQSYGVSVSCEYNPKKHFGRRQTFRPNNGKPLQFCDGIFSPFCLIGDSVEFDHSISQVYTPGEDQQDCMVLKIYKSGLRNVSYIDASDAQLIGTMTLQMPDMTGNLLRKVCVTMFFGQTTLHVKAVDQTSGMEQAVKLQFVDSGLERVLVNDV